MIAPELQRDLTILAPFSAATVDHTFRALRARNLIPTSPRGGTPLDMKPVDAAYALIALAIDGAPQESADKAAHWEEMRPRDDGTAFATFGNALAAVLADEGATLSTREVRICRDWPRATITAGDGDKQTVYEFGFASPTEARSFGFRVTPIRNEFVMPGGALHQLAINLAGRNDGIAEIIR